MAHRDFDDVLTNLKLGPWNFLYFFALGLCGFLVPCFVFAGGFIAPNMKFECNAPDSEGFTIDEKQCFYTIYENSTNLEPYTTKESCEEWTFVDKDFSLTLTSEFNLVCKDAYLRPSYLTLYMFASFLGSPLNGFLSDRFGRRRLITFCSLIAVGSTFLQTFSKNFTFILIMRFFTGLTSSPLIQTGYSLSMEVCPPDYRTSIGISLGVPWAVGTIWWGFLGYMIRDWRWLMRAVTVPAVILFISLLFLDESPRWCIVQGQHDRALKSFKKAARWNRSSLPSDKELLEKMRNIQELATEVKASIRRPNISGLKIAIKKIGTQFLILYRTPEIRKRSLLMYIVFLISSTVFYGLSLNAINFQLDPFLYMMVAGVTEIPAYTLTVPVVAKFGRIPPSVASFFICGITILVLAFIPSDPKWLITTMAMIGRFCISAAFQIVYLAATEVFPTEVRMQGLGTSSFLSALGGAAAPFITDLIGNIHAWLPSVIFGCLSFVGAIAAIFLPETLNKHLPETVLELEIHAKKAKEKSSSNEKEQFTVTEA